MLEQQSIYGQTTTTITKAIPNQQTKYPFPKSHTSYKNLLEMDHELDTKNTIHRKKNNRTRPHQFFLNFLQKTLLRIWKDKLQNGSRNHISYNGIIS